VLSGQLPQISWIVAPEAYTEHGNWPPNYGAWYVSHMLDVLTSNPELWSKTVLFYMFDENDGFFDHILPPTPPRSRAEGISTVGTTNELFAGSPSYPVPDFMPGPYGLGVRVPMIVISPWSKGGFVNSEVFDHTSLIRFLERRFGVIEPNITAWRRTVAGDLTSTFDFESPNTAAVSLPSTATYEPPDTERHADFVPTPPTNQEMPEQEPGTRPARALPYELHVDGEVGGGAVQVTFRNRGTAGAVFHVRFEDGSAPKTYTVAAGHESADTMGGGAAMYDFAVYGPNGFLRTFAGGFAADRANLAISAGYEKQSEAIALSIRNNGRDAQKISIFDAYTGKSEKRNVQPGHTATVYTQLHKSFGWYDLTVKTADDQGFARQLAGHVETGRPSVSDPAIGAKA
jgi:phospholipase C